eukprot:scaffold120901_cov30-Tisochrysis_lutea.AAC.1
MWKGRKKSIDIDTRNIIDNTKIGPTKCTKGAESRLISASFETVALTLGKEPKGLYMRLSCPPQCATRVGGRVAHGGEQVTSWHKIRIESLHQRHPENARAEGADGPKLAEMSTGDAAQSQAAWIGEGRSDASKMSRGEYNLMFAGFPTRKLLCPDQNHQLPPSD